METIVWCVPAFICSFTHNGGQYVLYFYPIPQPPFLFHNVWLWISPFFELIKLPAHFWRFGQYTVRMILNGNTCKAYPLRWQTNSPIPIFFSKSVIAPLIYLYLWIWMINSWWMNIIQDLWGNTYWKLVAWSKESESGSYEALYLCFAVI